MKFSLILLAIILVIPSSAFAGTWTIRIDQIRPIINYMKRLHPQKQQNSVSHIIKVAVTPPMARDKTRAVKKRVKALSAFHFQKTISAKFSKGKVLKKVKAVREVLPVQARIVGKTNGLPVLTVDFANRPLWKVLQDVSNDTGYVFTTKGVNLAKKVNLKGRYNFAVLLSKLFNGKGENTTVNLKNKRVKVILRRIHG